MMRVIGIVAAALGALWLGSAVARQVAESQRAPGDLPGFEGDGRSGLRPLNFSIDTTAPQPQRERPGPASRRFDPPGSPAATCTMPRAGEAQVVVFSVYEGDGVSTAALGDLDQETSVLDIEIEPGLGRLYLILSSYSDNIWRLSGAVDRVEQVVLIGDDGRPVEPDPSPAYADRDIPESQRTRIIPRRVPVWSSAQGVTGIAANRVTTVSDCFQYNSDPGSVAAAVIRAIVRNSTGRDPDVMAGHYSLAAVRLPSGRGAPGTGDQPTPDGFDRGFWTEGLRFQPAGLVHIDADEVVSAYRALPYDVLPQQFGLSQLIGSGHIEILSDGLKIVRPIPRFPAGLTGAHAVTFLLGRGVPLPAGSSGHSCVVDEAGGGTRSGALCGPF